MWTTIGHEFAIQVLQRAIQTQRIAHCYLLTGPTRIGKSHLALEMASALNCADAASPCGECSVCRSMARGAHPDLVMILPDGDHIKIDRIRRAQHELALSPYEGEWRVCIAPDFHRATVQASNAFLKTLEEPPSRVVIILTATDAGLLLPTIVSRCQVLPLRAVSGATIERALIERWHEREDVARLLARISGGKAGWAIQAAENPSILAQRQERLDDLLSLLEQGSAARIQAAERLGKRKDLSEVLGVWQTWWRDVVLHSASCADLAVNLDYRDSLARVADQCDRREAGQALRAIETTMKRLEQNVNPRLALEAMLLRWRRVSPGATQ